MFPKEKLDERYSNSFDELRIRVKFPQWRDFLPIVRNQDILHQYLDNNPLIVVHPGYMLYKERGSSGMAGVRENLNYPEYQEKRQEYIEEALRQKRSLIIFAPYNHLSETLEELGFDERHGGIPERTILVPTTEMRSNIKQELLGLTTREFFDIISKIITQGEVIGELAGGGGCADNLLEQANKSGIDLEKRSEYCFPYMSFIP